MNLQVMNQVMVNCRRKAGPSRDETGTFLSGIKVRCSVEDLIVQTHEVGRAVVEHRGSSVYNAMIDACALIADCTTLYTEDVHNDLGVEEQFRLVNPFPSAGSYQSNPSFSARSISISIDQGWPA